MLPHSTNYSNEKEEFGLLGLFQVDLENMELVEFAFMHHMQIPPTEVRKWEYYYYENQVERLVDVLKKKREAENNQNQQGQSFDVSKEAGKYLNKAKLPQVPNMKMPNIK